MAKLDDRLGYAAALRERRFGEVAELTLAAQSKATRALQAFALNPTGWIVVYGQRGSGKTTLLAKTVRAVRERGTEALFLVGANLFQILQATFDAPKGSVEAGYQQLYERIRSTPVLAIDDLGEVRRTPWSSDVLYGLVNDRYNARAATLFSLYEHPDIAPDEKHPRAEPHEAIRSRLTESGSILHSGSVDLRPVLAKKGDEQAKAR